MLVDEVVYAAREVAKTDARPGNYVATGGFGGIVGNVEGGGAPVITYRPARRHTHLSKLRLSLLPTDVPGVLGGQPVKVKVSRSKGQLVGEHFPTVMIVKYGRYAHGCCSGLQLDSWAEHIASSHPLAGVVGEGANPYGAMDRATEAVLERLAYSGYPVVRCGRGNTAGFTPRGPDWSISGSNLTATKARVLLSAALLHLGALPPAVDPEAPTAEECAATALAVARYQEIFDTH